MKKLTEEHKVQSPKKKRYQVNDNWTKNQGPEIEAETNFKGQCSNQEGYIFNLGTRAPDKFARTMKNMERYLRETYSDICKPAIVTYTPSTFPNPDMTTIVPVIGSQYPKADEEMTYHENNNIDEAIHQKTRKKDVYDTGIHNTDNLIVGKKT